MTYNDFMNNAPIESFDNEVGNSESERLTELFDWLNIAQQFLLDTGDPDLTMIEYYEIFEEIHELCANKVITASSDQFFTPDTKTNNPYSAATCSGSVVGEFVTLDIVNLPNDDGADEQHAICLKLLLGHAEQHSPVMSSNHKYYASIPITGAGFNVHPDENEEFQPDDNDQYCTLIDLAVLNEQINFNDLTYIFEELIQPITDEDGDYCPSLQHEIYLKYLNQLSKFNTVTAIADVGVYSTEHGMGILQSEGGDFVLDGQFVRFDIFATYSDEQSALKLMLTALDEDGDECSVVVDRITAIEFH